jgi:TPR repeat protein
MHTRSIPWLAGTVLLVAFACTAAAGPEDDYELGYAAYRRDDLMSAMSHLRGAADQGHAPSQALLGYILDRAEENEAAYELYESAARQGNADGMYGLGTLYLNGEGVEQSDERTVTWFARAAEAGHDVAAMALAAAYLDGAIGLAPSRPRAIEWLELAAGRGYEPAIERLASLAAER